MNEVVHSLLRRIEAIDAAAADNRLRAQSYQQMEDELKVVEGTATSQDGVVTVIAGPGGALKSIVFGPGFGGVSSASLSTAVLHTIARAQAAAARAQADVVRRNLGDTALLDQVLAEDARLFGDRPIQDPEAPTPPRQRTAPVEDDFEESFNLFGSQQS